MITAVKPVCSVAEIGFVVYEFPRDGSIPEALAEIEPGETGVVLDFQHVREICSSELSALIRFCVAIRSREKQVVVIRAAALVRDVFRVTRFSRLATIREDVPPEPARF